MGRKGSVLVPFLREALKCGKYGSVLLYDDERNDIFKINLAKSNKIDKDSLKILEDWNQIKDRNISSNNNYSVNKQRLLMALKRSVYLQFVPNSRKEIQYRFLSDEEITIKEIKGRPKSKNEPLLYKPQSENHPEVTSSVPEILSNVSECLYNGNNRILTIQNGHSLGDYTEISCKCPPACSDLEDFPLSDNHLEELAKLASEKRWIEVKDSLIGQRQQSELETRSLELQLYHYKSESMIGDEVIILFELDKNQNNNLNLMNAEFLKGIPGIMADPGLLKRLLSCHVKSSKFGEDNLLLFLKSNLEIPIFQTCIISDKIIYWNTCFFIISSLSN